MDNNENFNRDSINQENQTPISPNTENPSMENANTGNINTENLRAENSREQVVDVTYTEVREESTRNGNQRIDTNGEQGNPYYYPNPNGYQGYPNQNKEQGYPNPNGYQGYPNQNKGQGYQNPNGYQGYPNPNEGQGYQNPNGYQGYSNPNGYQGYPNRNNQPQSNPKATASLILGIVSLIFIFFGYGAILGIITAIVGLVLGILAKKETNAGTATTGIVLNIIGLAFCALVFLACVACVGIFAANPYYYY